MHSLTNHQLEWKASTNNFYFCCCLLFFRCLVYTTIEWNSVECFRNSVILLFFTFGTYTHTYYNVLTYTQHSHVFHLAILFDIWKVFCILFDSVPFEQNSLTGQILNRQHKLYMHSHNPRHTITTFHCNRMINSMWRTFPSTIQAIRV